MAKKRAVVEEQPAPVSEPEATPQQQDNGDTHRPEHEVRLGRIVGAVWRNVGDDGTPRFQTCVTRLYKNEETGTWDRSGYFGGAYDLLAVAEVARQCANYVFEALQSKAPF